MTTWPGAPPEHAPSNDYVRVAGHVATIVNAPWSVDRWAGDALNTVRLTVGRDTLDFDLDEAVDREQVRQLRDALSQVLDGIGEEN